MTPIQAANTALVASTSSHMGKVGAVSTPGKNPFEFISGAVSAVLNSLPLTVQGAIGVVPVTKSAAVGIGKVGNEAVKGVSTVTKAISDSASEVGQGVSKGLTIGIILIFVILALYLTGPGLLRGR